MNSFTVINFNGSRNRNIEKVGKILEFIEEYKPSVVCIQELNVETALRVFSSKYQVYINIEDRNIDGVGIVTLVRIGLEVKNVIIGLNGRIIGVKLNNIQVGIYIQNRAQHLRKTEKSFSGRS